MQQRDKRPKKTISDKKSGPKSGSKATLAYWESVLYQRRPGGNWWVRIQFRGRREKLSLGTPFKVAATTRARDIYQRLTVAKDWDTVLRELKPERVPVSRDTVGDFLEQLQATADPRKLRSYATAFRKIVADAFGIDGDKDKFDYRGGGHRRWIEKIHAVKLGDVTPAVIQKWKRDFLNRAGDNPIRLRSAKVSANSIMRHAKTLFGPKMTRHLSNPVSSPFTGVEFEPKQRVRYRSTINVDELTKAAHAELALSDPPAFLVFLLALGAGLRRLEIDRLEWSAIRWDENVIRIQPTEHFDIKTEHSGGDVQIDADLIEILRGYRAKARSTFVIDSPTLPRKHATCQNYRAHRVEKRLIRWLQSKGVNSQKPLHELRKESGSIINRKYGLTAAKDHLRHGNVSITAAHYIDVHREATTGIGSLLKSVADDKIVPLQDPPTETDSSGEIAS
jgi:integrase